VGRAALLLLLLHVEWAPSLPQLQLVAEPAPVVLPQQDCPLAGPLLPVVQWLLHPAQAQVHVWCLLLLLLLAAAAGSSLLHQQPQLQRLGWHSA
jgi:hypothetical protein